jgi:hypothetical protein
MMYQKGVDYLWVAAVISDSDMRDSLTDLILTTIGAAEGGSCHRFDRRRDFHRDNFRNCPGRRCGSFPRIF